VSRHAAHRVRPGGLLQRVRRILAPERTGHACAAELGRVADGATFEGDPRATADSERARVVRAVHSR